MISLIKHPTREQNLNSKLHLENQMVVRMNWLRLNKAEEIKEAAEVVKATMKPTAPIPAKINLVKSPVYKVKNPHLVNIDEELGGEEYYLTAALGTGHVEIPT